MRLPTTSAELAEVYRIMLGSPIYGTICEPYKRLFLFERPKFRKMREVHARRARKLRKRGETVRFLRWEYGHCIYGWSGPAPDSIAFKQMPRKKSDEPVIQTRINYETRWIAQI